MQEKKNFFKGSYSKSFYLMWGFLIHIQHDPLHREVSMVQPIFDSRQLRLEMQNTIEQVLIGERDMSYENHSLPLTTELLHLNLHVDRLLKNSDI